MTIQARLSKHHLLLANERCGAAGRGDGSRRSLRRTPGRRFGPRKPALWCLTPRRTDQVVLSSGFIGEKLVEELQKDRIRRLRIAPMIIAQGFVSVQGNGGRAGKVPVYGVDSRFWRFHGVSVDRLRTAMCCSVQRFQRNCKGSRRNDPHSNAKASEYPWNPSTAARKKRREPSEPLYAPSCRENPSASSPFRRNRVTSLPCSFRSLCFSATSTWDRSQCAADFGPADAL